MKPARRHLHDFSVSFFISLEAQFLSNDWQGKDVVAAVRVLSDLPDGKSGSFRASGSALCVTRRPMQLALLGQSGQFFRLPKNVYAAKLAVLDEKPIDKIERISAGFCCQVPANPALRG